MPIQTNCAQAIRLFHVPIPGTEKDAERLRKAFEAENLKMGKLEIISVKDPLMHGRKHKGDRIIIQIINPLPLEVIGPAFWKIVGKLISKTKEPWWDFCDLVTDWKPKRSHPHAHSLGIWRVTKKGDLKYLYYEDPAWFADEELPKKKGKSG